jgi:hypothetical protein
MENVGRVYAHLVYLWYFGNFVVIWYIFHRFGILCQEKSGNPGREEEKSCRKFTQKFFMQGF